MRAFLLASAALAVLSQATMAQTPNSQNDNANQTVAN